MIKTVLWFCIGVMVGYIAHQVRHTIDLVKCPSYVTKYATWVGYVSFNHDEVRCFWIENEYPRRVRAEPRIIHGRTE
jgi:hypothetical protein